MAQAKPRSRVTRQTVTRDGKRIRVTTTTHLDGSVSTKVTDAPPLEWRLQAAAIKRLHGMAARGLDFAFAGDMNGLPLLSPSSKVKAKATGMTPGEHDIRIYLPHGRLGLIELKNADGRPSSEQTARHKRLAELGFDRQAVVKEREENEVADAVERIVRGWMGE
ncbi:hypothetical protein [Consotaella salsifontis]|uniref:VRR-NUC domain-containing protein n=1 Tax=Consotaella salsifontis TaxID=1365950 RepID=A0A1T4SSD6_9HYPH|nr:hypothetical protein [Consotaella salsifontis]SKA31083.1 hypothetical protein SAMN05428963_113114 [Consotaella salsifontis]